MCKNEKYSIKRLWCRCSSCNNEFSVDISNDNTLVKLYYNDGAEVRWIKVFGDNGYLDLLSKLIEGRNVNDPIDMPTIKKFEEKINAIYKNKDIDKLVIDKGIRVCPVCKSKHINVISEEILEIDNLKFLNLEL